MADPTTSPLGTGTLAELLADSFADAINGPSPAKVAQQKAAAEAARKAKLLKIEAEAADNFAANKLLEKMNAEAAAARGEPAPFVSPLFPNFKPSNKAEWEEYERQRKERQESAARLASYFAGRSDADLALELNRYGVKTGSKVTQELEKELYGRALVDEYVARLTTGRLRTTDQGVVVNPTTEQVQAAIGTAIDVFGIVNAPLVALAPNTPAPGQTPTPSPFADPLPGVVVVPGKPGAPAGSAVPIGPGAQPNPYKPDQVQPPGTPTPFPGVPGNPFGFPDELFKKNPADP